MYLKSRNHLIYTKNKLDYAQENSDYLYSLTNDFSNITLQYQSMFLRLSMIKASSDRPQVNYIILFMRRTIIL